MIVDLHHTCPGPRICALTTTGAAISSTMERPVPEEVVIRPRRIHIPIHAIRLLS